MRKYIYGCTKCIYYTLHMPTEDNISRQCSFDHGGRNYGIRGFNCTYSVKENERHERCPIKDIDGKDFIRERYIIKS